MTLGKKGKPTVDEAKLKKEASENFAKGKYKKALPLYLELSQCSPKDLRVKTKVGDILHKLGQIPEAADVYRSVAAQYAQQGMLIQAIAVNKMILQIKPDDQGIKRELAILYGRKKQSSSTSALGKISTIIRPIQIREVAAHEGPVRVKGQGTAYVNVAAPTQAPLEIQVPREASPGEVEDFEIPGRLIDFSGAVDLGAIAEISLPPSPLFSNLGEEALERILGLLHRREIKPAEEICREGEAGDSIFIISEGELAVSTRDTAGRTIELATLSEGEFFGEFGYFSDRRRHATVTAECDSVVLELGRADLDRVVAEFPAVALVLQNFYRERLLDTLLAKSRIFRDLTTAQRQILAERFTNETHPPKTFIMREGEEGDAMYLIQEGKLSVTTLKDGKEVELAVLREGDFCGEFSVLTGAKRTANVRSQGSVKLLKLSKDAARDLLIAHVDVFKTLKEIADERVAGTIRTLSSVSTTVGEGDLSKGGLV